MKLCIAPRWRYHSITCSNDPSQHTSLNRTPARRSNTISGCRSIALIPCLHLVRCYCRLLLLLSFPVPNLGGGAHDQLLRWGFSVLTHSNETYQRRHNHHNHHHHFESLVDNNCAKLSFTLESFHWSSDLQVCMSKYLLQLNYNTHHLIAHHIIINSPISGAIIR